MNKKDVYELTNPQKSIWNMEKFFEGTTINNICTTGTIYEKIDLPLLKQAINNLVQKNDSFRIQIQLKNNIPYQTVTEFVPFDIDVVHVKDESEVKKIEQNMVNYKFNMINSTLFRFKIVVFDNGFCSIILNLSHMISDSWSLGLTIQEIVKEYHALLNNEILPETNNSYIDYIKSEQEYKNSEKYKNDKKYWEDIFSSIPGQATIPTTKKIKSNISNKADRKSFSLNTDIVTKINDFCKKERLSVFNFLMAIYSIYIGRVSNLNDFVIGTPILNRTNFKDKHTTGMFVNVVPVKMSIPENTSFIDYTHTISSNMMGTLKHQKYSYNAILDDLRTKNKNTPNLYNIIISYQITKAIDEQLGNYKGNWVFNNYCGNDFNIHISDVNDTGELIFDYDYLVDKYSSLDIQNLHDRILAIINQILSNNTILTDNIEIVTDEEKHKILHEFNNTKVNYAKNKTIVDLFEEQVKKTPNNIAVVFKNQKLSYKELNEKANSLARHLISNGVKSNTICAVVINRSTEMIIAIWAILKAGAAYIPIDPNYPKERIDYILKDSKVKLLLTNNSTLTNLPDLNFNTINLDDSSLYDNDSSDLEIKHNKEDLCYLIYTSGSTGTPKGVMLKKGSVMNLVNYCNNYVQYLKEPSYRSIVSVTTVSFDIFMFETLISLQRGLKLVIADENAQTDSALLNDIFKKENIEIMQTTPSRMKLLINDYKYIPALKKLKYVTLAGEQLPMSLVNSIKKISPNVVIYNGYGPSETTVFSTLTDVTNHTEITIGKPLDNTQIYILDNHKNLCPIGIPGELYISGDGVGKGYINKPDLTKSSFIKDIFNNSSIMYKSGDTGFYKENGEIVCLGRFDSQVKIRGLRIELEEIEQVLMQDSNILDCCVIKKDFDNRELLCAYYTTQGTVDENIIRKLLRKKLPQYMVPQYFVELESLPYTPNGKVDRKSLPEPALKESIQKEESRNKIDLKLIKLVEDVLNIKNITISDDILNLGADSLTAINLSTRIFETFKVRVFVKDILDNTKISDLSDFISDLSKSKTTKNTIKKTVSKKYYPLSSAQRRIYYTSKMIGEQNIVYNTPGAILIDAILDKGKVQKCFNKIIKRQKSFRTSFVTENGEIKQKISSSANLEILTFENSSSEISNLVNNFAKPFDLSKAPLLRIELHYIDDCKTLLLLDSHHIVVDGTSLNILIKEFCKLYNDEKLDTLEIEYKDYSEWENNYLSSKELEKSKNYWINKFKDNDIPSVNLPYDYNIPSERSYSGNTIYNRISSDDFDKYIDFAQKLGLSPYMFFVSAFFILLYKYTAQNEILLGTPTSGRTNTQLENIIGMFVNNIVIDANIDSNNTFKEFANSIKSQILDDLTYQDYPYDLLVKDLKINNSDMSNPLFDIMFTYQNTAKHELIINDKTAEILNINPKISKFNLSVEINPNTNAINLEYRTDLFKKDTIKKLYEHYLNTLNIICENENILIKNIAVISENEKNIILHDFNDTKATFSGNYNFIELFEKIVKENSDNIALVFEDQKITYKELNKRINGLANYLRFIGISKNDRIAVSLKRSPELIISIYAVIKSGASYVLIDNSLPEERIDFILKDSKCKFCISDNASINTIKSINAINISNFDFINSNTKNLTEHSYNDNLCVIYTSGSTGKPKGVLLHKHGFINLMAAFDKEMNISKYNNILGIASVSFDMFTVELFTATLFGNTLVLANEEEQRNPIAMGHLIQNNNVEFLITTPSRIELLLDEKNECPLANVKALQLGGEKLTTSLYNKLSKCTNAKIFNGYGPTEITACCTNKLVASDKITIGKPLLNTQVYICDNDMNLLPIGVSGEICVAGNGVSNGYLNNHSATNKNFIKNPFGNGLLYKTGDIGKFTQDGEIEYIGRTDFQIKIRGLRIELSEIETHLNSLSDIDNSVVLYNSKSNNPYLIAFVTSKDIINVHTIKTKLSKLMPIYMVPRYIIQLEDFPITSNGKIDKKALENYKLSDNTNVFFNNYVAPETDMQKLFCNIWKSLLNIDIGIDDDLFDIGADSLLAIKFKSQLLAHNIDLPYSDIFKYKTIRKLCNNLSTESENDYNINNAHNYDEIHKLLKSQNDNNVEKVSPNVLLLGSTGFIGMHIINSFIKNSTGKIYCIVREKNKVSSLVRFMELLHFYFGNKLDKYINKRIYILNGDILKTQFGLSDKIYSSLSTDVDVVINTAANVKHYGDSKRFKSINIDSINSAIDFCIKFDKRFIHLSSLSISGNLIVENKTISKNKFLKQTFSENDFYIGQSLENVYAKSKFEAEKLILNSIINNNLHAQIIRLGNITSRFKDGLFQVNPTDNAFANRIKTFINLKIIPNYLLDDYLEFTPVDLCADTIINILNNDSKNRYVYHIYNDNFVKSSKLIDYLDDLGYKITVVSDADFRKTINSILIDSKYSNMLSGIINDFNINHKLNYSSYIKITSDKSKKFLEKNSFKWPIINKIYIQKYIKYLEKIDFFNKE